MTESLPRISAKMTLLDKTMASNAVIMKDNNICSVSLARDVSQMGNRIEAYTSARDARVAGCWSGRISTAVGHFEQGHD